MLGGNHAGTVGDQVLPVSGIVTVVGGLAGPNPAMQDAAGIACPDPLLCRLPEPVPGDGAHQFADLLNIVVVHGSHSKGCTAAIIPVAGVGVKTTTAGETGR